MCIVSFAAVVWGGLATLPPALRDYTMCENVTNWKEVIH